MYSVAVCCTCDVYKPSVYSVAVCCAGNLSTEQFSAVTTMQGISGHSDNTEASTTITSTVLTTELNTKVTEMTTKVTVAPLDSVVSVSPALTELNTKVTEMTTKVTVAPLDSVVSVSPALTELNTKVTEMTTKVTVAPLDSVVSVSPALTSVEPAHSSSEESRRDNITSPGTAPSVSVTTSTATLFSDQPLLSTSQVGDLSIATDDVSVSVSQDKTNSSDMVTVSPGSTITVTTVMSPAPQNASMQVNVSSVLSTSEFDMSTDSSDTVTVKSELPKMSTPSNDTVTMTSVLPNIKSSVIPSLKSSVMPSLNVSMTATLALSTPALSSTMTPDNVTDLPVTVSNDTNVTTTATTNDTTSLVVNASSPELVAPSNKVYKLVFEGNCSLLELPGFRDQFVKVLSSLIKIKFKLKDEDLKIDDEITCGSLIVDIRLNSTDPAMDAKMMTLGDSSVSLNITAGGTALCITLMKVSNVPFETPRLTSTGGTTEMPSNDGIVLSRTEQIIVIVCAIVGGSLLIFGVLSIVYTCHTRNYKSFDLGDTPTSNVHLEDFTLTKMDRSYPLYDDQDMVVAYDSDVKPVSPESIYQHGYFPRATAPLSTFKSAETFEPQTLVAVGSEGDRQSAALTGSHHSSGDITDTETGFENPSFSGEDFLDPAAEHMVEDLQKRRGSK